MKISGRISMWRFWTLVAGVLLLTFSAQAAETFQDIRFEEFEKWTKENGLRWEAVGLDIEPTLNEYSVLLSHKGRLIFMAIKRALDSGRVSRAKEAYSDLIREIQSRGYKVQTYQLTFMADERNAHTSFVGTDFRHRGCARRSGSFHAVHQLCAPVWCGTNLAVCAVGANYRRGKHRHQRRCSGRREISSAELGGVFSRPDCGPPFLVNCWRV